MQNPVFASLLVDDPPINATWWWRVQQLAFGYTPSETKWGRNWLNLEAAPRFTVKDVCAFADFVEEFGVRGKFTLLPCPAGHGRIDREVRGYSKAELAEILGQIRTRIAPRMDITPEVLTHTMALDPDTGALLPHSETAWVSHLAVTRQLDVLRNYIATAYRILSNAGFSPHGLTVGGMTDPSGIAAGQMIETGKPLAGVGEALLDVEREFTPGARESFIWAGAAVANAEARERRVPETCYTATDGCRVFNMQSIDDVAFGTLHGDADLDAEIDKLISRDLNSGSLVADAEAGRILAITLHTQTLNSRNTGQGLALIREVVRRLTQRYSKRLIWKTTLELCRAAGV